MPIKAVIFDFGGVLIGFSEFQELCKDVSKKYNIPLDDILAAVQAKEVIENYQGMDNPLFRGTISAEEMEDYLFKDFINAKFNINLTEKMTSFSKWIGPGCVIIPHKCMMIALNILRKNGILTGLLTNNFYIDKDRRIERIPMDRSLFDVIVESAIEGYVKPEHRAYQIVQERLPGILPEEILFLDDTAENLTVPEQLGWNTILVNRNDIYKAVQDMEQFVGFSLREGCVSSQ